MSVNKKMTAIANAIRDKTSGTHLLTLDDMPEHIDGVYRTGYITGEESGRVEGYSIGYDAGTADEHAKCVAKHFVTTVTGNGQTSISFHVPFKPDFLAINCGDSDLYGTSTLTVASVYFDLCAFGLIAGISQVGATGGFKNGAMSTESYKTRYAQDENGIVTVGNVGSQAGTFKANRPYMVCAVKYEEQTDKDRITEYVRSLEGSGSVTLNLGKVNAAFTEEEWSALTDEKPGWTFGFI